MKPILNPFVAASVLGLISLTSIATAANFFWDADPLTANNQNGDGLWTSDIANTNWTATAGGTPNISWTGSSANTAFIGNAGGTGYDNPATGGTITLGEDITLFALSMSSGQSGSYVIEGNGHSLILSGTGCYLANNNSTATLTVNAPVTGTSGLGKFNSGKVILNAANTYSGLTNITGGTLAVGASDLIPDGDLTVNGATATFDLGMNQSDTVGTVTLDGGGAINGTGTSVLTSTGTFEMKNGSATAGLAGDVALNKTTTGTVRLSGNNTYTGVTSITSGTLQFARTASLYNGNTASWTAANLVVSSGATLAVNVGGSGEFTAADINLLKSLGSPTDGFTAGSSLGLDTTNASGVFTYSSDIADTNGGLNPLGLSKLGTGTLALTGVNSYSGVTQILGGALRLDTDGADLNTNSNLTLTNGVVETNGTLALTVGTAGGNIQWTAVTGRGGFSAVGGDLDVTLNGGSMLVWSATAGTSKFGAAALIFGSPNANGKTRLTNNIALNFTRTVQVDSGAGGDSAELSGVLSHADGGITKNGTGTLILSGSNTFGSTNVINGGTLVASHNNALGNTTGITNLPAAGGTLAFQNNINTAENITLSARDGSIPQLRNISGDNTLGGTLTWNTGGASYRVQSDDGKLSIQSAVSPAGGNKTLFVQGDGDVEFSGAVSNTANTGTALVVSKSGAGTLTLSNPASTYTGATRVNGGTLVVTDLADAGSPSSIGAAADFSFNLLLNGGTLRHDAANATATNRKFAIGLGGGTIDSSAADPAHTVSFTTSLAMGFNSEEGARTLTLTGSNTGENLIALDLADDAAGNPTSLVKSGAGTWKLTFPNTYTGGTTVSEGMLILTSDNCLADTSTLTIADGAELHLPNEGTDVVGSLVIDNVVMEDGVYDSSNTGGAITGAGKIQVGAGSSASPFEQWMSTQYPGITSPDNAPAADPDRDGTPNILEFALMGNPSDPSDNGAIASLIQDASAPAGRELTLIIAVRDGASFTGGSATVDGITYTIEGSLDLAFPGAAVSSTGPADTAPAATGLPDLTGTAWEYHTFKLDASEGLLGRGFLRLKLTQP